MACEHLLQDIKGYVFEFCHDQHGSRFIQQKLAEARPEEIMAVYEEVEPHVIALMQDVFGNYVIQKCFEHGTEVRTGCASSSSCAKWLSFAGGDGPVLHSCSWCQTWGSAKAKTAA